MKEKEITQIIIAIIVPGFVSGFMELVRLEVKQFALIVIFAGVIIGTNILSKKAMASKLDADVEHEIWRMDRYGFKPGDHLKKSIMTGVIFPIFVTIVTLGTIKLMSILTYETRALKRRAAKRFGPYSFTEMTDYHNALVGSAGIVPCLLITFITYWLPGSLWTTIGKMAVLYAFFNMVPISKLDGSQIYFGSRVLWSVLGVITLIFLLYAMFLV